MPIKQTIPTPICPNCHSGCNVACAECDMYINAEPIADDPLFVPQGRRAVIMCQWAGSPPKAIYWVWANKIIPAPPGYQPNTDYATHAEILLELMQSNPEAAKIAIEMFKANGR